MTRANFKPTPEQTLYAILFAADRLQIESDPLTGNALVTIPVELLAHFHTNAYESKIVPHPEIPGCACLLVKQKAAESKLVLLSGQPSAMPPDPEVGKRLLALLGGDPEHQS